MGHRTKFRADRSNCCRGMAIFRLFKIVAVRHLGFVIHLFGPPTKRIRWYLSFCKIWLQSVRSVDNMQVLAFCALSSKMPIHDPRCFLGVFYPKIETSFNSTLKRHTFARKLVI